jgi:hypothetical protein
MAHVLTREWSLRVISIKPVARVSPSARTASIDAAFPRVNQYVVKEMKRIDEETTCNG